jgi:hypothetical protein
MRRGVRSQRVDDRAKRPFVGRVGWRWHWYALSYVARIRPVLLAYEASCHINVIGHRMGDICNCGQGSAMGKESVPHPVLRVRRPKPQKFVQLFLLLTQIGFMCTVLVELQRGEATGGQDELKHRNMTVHIAHSGPARRRARSC